MKIGKEYVDKYPTEEELERIRKWNPEDYHGLMQYIRKIWNYADCGYWFQDGETYRISTGGWGGNEDIIGAMMGNHVFWLYYLESYKRGGHYVFERYFVKRDKIRRIFDVENARM